MDGDDGAEARSWQALGHAFTVRTPIAALDAYLAEALADLPASDRPDRDVHHYRLDQPSSDAGWRTRRDTEVVGEDTSPSRALALLLWRINRSVIEQTDDLVLLHAGGVVIDGVGVVVAGEMEVGKSTLVTGLLCAGADYLSDEAVGIELDRLELRGYRKALSLDPGSWPLFPALAPRVTEEVRPFLPDQWQVRASTLPGVTAQERAEPGMVVLPRFEAGAPVTLRRLRGGEALRRLAGCVFPTALARARTLERLARLLDAAPCVELSYGRLDEAVTTVSDLVAAGPHAPHGVPSGADELRGPAGDGVSASTARSRVGLADRVRRHAGASLIAADGEHVLHLAGTDALLRVDAMGAALWERLVGDRPLDDLVHELAEVSGAAPSAISSSLLHFVNELHDHGFIRITDDSGGTAPKLG